MLVALFAVVALDELGSGVAPASVAELASDLGMSSGMLAGAVITAFYGLTLFEAPLLAWADRGRVRVVSSVSLAALGLSLVLGAIAFHPVVLLASLALYGPASGCMVAAAEGTLVEARPDERERTMTRLTIAAAVGDLVVPPLLGLLAWCGLGWRAAFGLGALVAFALAIVHARTPALDRPMASSEDDDEDEDGNDEHDVAPESAATAPGREAGTPAPRPALRALIRLLARHPALLGWSLAGTATALLDEVLVAFAVVHLEAHAGAGPLERALGLGALTVGGLAGLVALERALDRVRPLVVLACAGAVCTAALTLVTLTTSAVLASAALALAGASAATFHPLLKARAYRALPGRPAIVNAAASLFIPLDALLPLALGALAAAAGSGAALAVIALAPLVIAVAACLLLRPRAR